MSGTWTYVGNATSIEDWQKNSPWKTNAGDLLSDGGALIYFQAKEGDQLTVSISPLDGSQPQEGTATYHSDGSIVGKFDNEGSPYLIVASLAQVTDGKATEWHLYSLVMKDDPENVAVIGAQGSG